MRLVFFSPVLNHHQAGIADEFYRILGDGYKFVELSGAYDSKGASEDYSQRPYIVKAWSADNLRGYAMQLATEADVCVFAGVGALPYARHRMQRGLLSFDMSERLLKRGLLNLASPRILKSFLTYHVGGWADRHLYKLACSAFVADDCQRLHMFRDKCFKWGYFTKVPELDIDTLASGKFSGDTRIMWCARMIDWKHPELAVRLAVELKKRGYRFTIDMYGSGYMRQQIADMIAATGTEDVVKLRGNVPNEMILTQMRQHDIFIFTSDKNEGWGAVANEAMANGCLLIASDAIGAVPYLVQDGVNGCQFTSESVDSLVSQVETVINNPDNSRLMIRRAYASMRDTWSPAAAASSLLTLISDLRAGRPSSIPHGPCSQALPIKTNR